MSTTWLLDAGPLVAYLVAAEPDHEVVANALEAFRGRLVTTSAVIVEAMHFLRRGRSGPMRLAEFCAEGHVMVHDFCDPVDLIAAARWMERYAATPMDFADATLVLLADAIAERRILTLDRRGFSTFRNARKEPFELVLDTI